MTPAQAAKLVKEIIQKKSEIAPNARGTIGVAEKGTIGELISKAIKKIGNKKDKKKEK